MSENTRAAVKGAAVQLFATLGFAGTGIRQLARAAGVTSSTLYHYMGTKDDLLFELMQESLARLNAAGLVVRDSTEQPEVVIARLVHVHVLSHALFQPETTVVDTELRALGPQMRAEIVQLRDDYEAFWRDAIRLGCRQGSFTVPDEQQARFALLEMCSGVASWYSPRGPEDLEHLAVTHAALALALLRADTNGPAHADTGLARELMGEIWGRTMPRPHPARKGQP